MEQQLNVVNNNDSSDDCGHSETEQSAAEVVSKILYRDFMTEKNLFVSLFNIYQKFERTIEQMSNATMTEKLNYEFVELRKKIICERCEQRGKLERMLHALINIHKVNPADILRLVPNYGTAPSMLGIVNVKEKNEDAAMAVMSSDGEEDIKRYCSIENQWSIYPLKENCQQLVLENETSQPTDCPRREDLSEKNLAEDRIEVVGGGGDDDDEDGKTNLGSNEEDVNNRRTTAQSDLERQKPEPANEIRREHSDSKDLSKKDDDLGTTGTVDIEIEMKIGNGSNVGATSNAAQSPQAADKGKLKGGQQSAINVGRLLPSNDSFKRELSLSDSNRSQNETTTLYVGALQTKSDPSPPASRTKGYNNNKVNNQRLSYEESVVYRKNDGRSNDRYSNDRYVERKANGIKRRDTDDTCSLKHPVQLLNEIFGKRLVFQICTLSGPPYPTYAVTYELNNKIYTIQAKTKKEAKYKCALHVLRDKGIL